jgi:hypothetical protein
MLATLDSVEAPHESESMDFPKAIQAAFHLLDSTGFGNVSWTANRHLTTSRREIRATP